MVTPQGRLLLAQRKCFKPTGYTRRSANTALLALSRSMRCTFHLSPCLCRANQIGPFLPLSRFRQRPATAAAAATDPLQAPAALGGLSLRTSGSMPGISDISDCVGVQPAAAAPSASMFSPGASVGPGQVRSCLHVVVDVVVFVYRKHLGFPLEEGSFRGGDPFFSWNHSRPGGNP